MKSCFCKSIALMDGLTTYHYKVILLLAEKERTQSQLGTELGVAKQNIYKVCHQLLNLDILSISRIEGNNKFLTLNQTKVFQMAGQMKVKDFNC